MPLTKKGKQIMQSMKAQYGSKHGERVFYASKNKGRIRGVEKGFFGHLDPTAVTVRPIRTSVRSVLA